MKLTVTLSKLFNWNMKQKKKEKKMISREKREAMKEYKREIARQKAKAKHRGR